MLSRIPFKGWIVQRSINYGLDLRVKIPVAPMPLFLVSHGDGLLPCGPGSTGVVSQSRRFGDKFAHSFVGGLNQEKEKNGVPLPLFEPSGTLGSLNCPLDGNPIGLRNMPS